MGRREFADQIETWQVSPAKLASWCHTPRWTAKARRSGSSRRLHSSTSKILNVSMSSWRYQLRTIMQCITRYFRKLLGSVAYTLKISKWLAHTMVFIACTGFGTQPPF